jgi:CheY-like chemotaxis protein
MSRNVRILIIDDNRAIHDDFRKILAPSPRKTGELNALENMLFGAAEPGRNHIEYEIFSAYQGREALELVEQAERDGQPFAGAFVDVRMPPGWDGVETAGHLWRVSPRLQLVICTAFSDYSWSQIAERLGRTEPVVILRKPFDPVEVQQLAHGMVDKWSSLKVGS